MATEFGYFPQKPTAGDHFIVEDLLDFSHDDNGSSGAYDTLAADSPASSVDVTPMDSCNSSFSFASDVNFPPVGDFNFSGELSVPHDDLAELEWLSNFVEESFSGMSAFKARPDDRSEARYYHHGQPPQQHVSAQVGPAFSPDMPVPGKARSKRSRAAPGSWASRLVHISPAARPGPKKPTESSGNGEVRRCLHCASEKTPQWRAGPLGPKTLCNACGVRYKSGRLVPEYRPAASPTFVQTEHSNSHRKVVELRRQKEMMRQQHMQQQLLHYPNSEDYLIHQQVGSDFRKPI